MLASFGSIIECDEAPGLQASSSETKNSVLIRFDAPDVFSNLTDNKQTNKQKTSDKKTKQKGTKLVAFGKRHNDLVITVRSHLEHQSVIGAVCQKAGNVRHTDSRRTMTAGNI